MSYVLTDFVNCETLQSELTDHFGCNYTSTLKPSEVAMVSWLFSPANTAGTLQRQISSDGKVKDVKLVYTPRIPMGAVDTTIDAADCTSTNTRGQRSETYTIDENVGVSINSKIDTEDLIRYCKSNPLYVQDTIAAMMDAAVRRMSYILSGQVIALAGEFGEGESDVTNQFKTVSTRKPSSNDLSTDFIEEIDYAADNAGYCQSPAIFGYGEIYKAYKALRASNCCSDAGINIAQLSQLTGSMFMADRNVGAIFNDTNKFITMDAGAAQVLTYNRYLLDDGVMVVNTATTQRGIVTHPVYGIPFDFKADYSCGVWSIFISLAFKTVGMPDDIYEDEDIYTGVTGINKFVVSNS